jgi:ABC-type Fe3+-siderophore transport system permease subunit
VEIVKSGTVHISGAPVGSGKAEERMGGIRLLTTLYAIFFVLIILIAIGSFFGVFDNPLIDPGL